MVSGWSSDGHHDLLAAILLVAVIVGVDDAFADGHADFVDLFLGKAGGFRYAHGNTFREVHALEKRLEHDFDPLGFGRHPKSGIVL